jgi:hypothetical protein
MSNDDQRRADDKWMRDNLTQRLVAIETTQKLYHDEIKSITEGLHNQYKAVLDEVKTLNKVVFGHEQPGILENIRGIMWKGGILTTVGFGIVAFTLKLFAPTINKLAEKIVGHDAVSDYNDQQSKKRLQFYNNQTKKYEYYIQFEPVGQQGQKGQTQ